MRLEFEPPVNEASIALTPRCHAEARLLKV